MKRNLFSEHAIGVKCESMDNFDDSYKERGECERINDYIKDTVKFNVKGIPNDSKELYSKLSFVTYQMMILNNIQNGIEPVNSFGRYF